METREKRPGPAGHNIRKKRPAPRGRRPAERPAPERRKRPIRQRPAEQVSSRPARRTKEPVRRPRPERQPVVYTDPQPFNGKKLVLQILSITAAALAVLFGLSIFFKVDLDKATVSGNQKYTANDILEASGLRDGSNLLTLSDAEISGTIENKLPYVNKVRVGIKLPDIVHIEIEELKVPYAIEAENGSWWLMSADGRIVDTVTMSEARTYTRVLGIKIQDTQVGGSAAAAELEPKPEPTQEEPTAASTAPETTAEASAPAGSEPPAATKPHEPVLRGSDYLDTALNILSRLEENGILGDVVSVDVTDLNRIELWYGRRYQINLGTGENLAHKIRMLRGVVDNTSQYQSGQLDISFTTWPDQVGYTPFA